MPRLDRHPATGAPLLVERAQRAHAKVEVPSVYGQPRPQDQPHATGLLTQELLALQLPADRNVDVWMSNILDTLGRTECRRTDLCSMPTGSTAASP